MGRIQPGGSITTAVEIGRRKQGIETKQSAPDFRERSFYTLEGQRGALTRGRDALAEGSAQVVRQGTLNNANITGVRESSFRANDSLIRNEGLKFGIEQAANNPLATASAVATFGGAGAAAGATKGVVGIGIRGLQGIAVTESVRVGATTIGTNILSTQEEIKGVRDRNVQSAVNASFRTQNQQITGFGSRALYETSLLTGSGTGFRNILRNELIDRGYSGERLERAVTAGMRTRTGRGIGEISSFLAISAGAERTGRFGQRVVRGGLAARGITTAGSFGKSATATAIAVAPAGFAEGFSQSITQRRQRGESDDLGASLTIGGYGAASAAILGGLIGGAAGSGRKTLRRGSELVANIADPYEKPGDILAGSARAGFAPVVTTTITPTATSTITPTATTSNTFTSVPTPSITPTPTTTFTNTPSYVFTPTQTPTPSPSITPSNTFVTTPTPTNTITPTPTNTITPTFTTNIKIPAFFAIPAFGAGGGGSRKAGRRRKGKRKSGTPGTLIGRTFNIGTRKRAGVTYSGLGIRR